MSTEEQVYHWDDGFIELLGNVANITFCIFVIPLASLVDVYGMRGPILATIIALLINSGFRCIPVELVGQNMYNILSLMSMVCNGIAGTIETLSPPVLSALWFPVQERATATAIMATANTLGTAAGFLTAFVVPENGSDKAILFALYNVYWVYFSICIITFVCTLIYFPSKPPTAPSRSAAVPKVDIKVGMSKLLVHGKFWTVVLCAAIPLGVYGAWLNVLGINLKDYNISQVDSGWIGFGSSLSGAIAGLITGRIADKFPGKLTIILASMYSAASLFLLWFSLSLAGVLPFSLTAANILAVVIGFCLYGTYPLFFELGKNNRKLLIFHYYIT